MRYETITNTRITKPLTIRATDEAVRVRIEGCEVDDGGLIRLQGNIESAEIKEVQIHNWSQQAIVIQGLDETPAPRNITIENVQITEPIPGRNVPLQITRGESYEMIRGVELERVRITSDGVPWVRHVQYGDSPTSATADQFYLYGIDGLRMWDCISEYGGENGFSLTGGTRNVYVSACIANRNQGQGWHIGLHKTPVDLGMLVECDATDNWQNDANEGGSGCGYLVHSASLRMLRCRASGQEYGLNAARTSLVETHDCEFEGERPTAGFAGAIITE